MTAPAAERLLPDICDLSWDVYHGRACVWCNQLLMEPGSEPVARIEAYSGAHDLSTTVWACAACLTTARRARS